MTKFQKEALKTAVLNTIVSDEFVAMINSELEHQTNGLQIESYQNLRYRVTVGGETDPTIEAHLESLLDIIQPHYYEEWQVQTAERTIDQLERFKAVLYNDLGATLRTAEEIPNIKELKKNITPLIESIKKSVNEFKQSGKWLVWLNPENDKMTLLATCKNHKEAKALQEQLGAVKTLIEPELNNN